MQVVVLGSEGPKTTTHPNKALDPTACLYSGSCDDASKQISIPIDVGYFCKQRIQL